MQTQFALPEFAFCEQGDGSELACKFTHKSREQKYSPQAKFSHLLIRFFFKKHAPFQSDKERVFCYLNLFLVLQAILLLIVPICGCIRLLYPLYQSFLVDIAVSEIHNLKTVSFV